MSDNSVDVARLTDAVNCLIEAKWRIDEAVTNIADARLSDAVNSLFMDTKLTIEMLEERIRKLKREPTDE